MLIEIVEFQNHKSDPKRVHKIVIKEFVTIHLIVLEDDRYERWLTLGVMMPMVLALYLILVLILYSMCCRKSREQILLERQAALLQQVLLLRYFY